MSADYQPGAAPPETALLDAIVSPFLAGDEEKLWLDYLDRNMQPGNRLRDFRRETRRVKRLLRGQCDPQALLDGACMRLVEDAGGKGTYSGQLLSSLVQALYETGANRLTLDVRRMQHRPFDLLDDLAGSEREPLRLTCFADGALSVAGNVEHCVLDLSSEDGLVFAGCDASSSRISLHGEVDEAGKRAAGCDFYLESLSAVSSDRNRDCSYYVARTSGSPKRLAAYKRLRKDGFFRRNTLYLPRDGEWVEFH